MAETVGQHSVAAFTSPVNGTTPIDANSVRGNDNTVRSAYVDHDADPGIHVQSSTLASRPAAGTAGRKWVTVSSGRYQFWYDDGSRWHEVASDAVNVDCLADANLAKGDVVKVTGFNNGQNLPTVNKVTSSTDVAFGVVENTVTSGNLVQIVNTGLIEDVNTGAFAINDILYPNTSGGFTATKPTSGNYQPIAFVLRSNQNNGVLYVEFSAPRIVERSNNQASTIVLRDASGNFAAGTITAGALTSTGLVTFASLKGTGATTVTDILNDGTMATASATTLATSSSIKTYVDSQVATVDTLAEVLANGNTTGANNIIVSSGQKIQTPTIAALDGTSSATIADSTGVMTIASSVLTTTDINGGTIDGTTIGGSSAAAGTFTTATATTGNITTVNATTVDATNVEVTNVKAKDGTASIAIADSTGVATITAAPILSALTASQAVFTNSSKALVSNAITGTGNVVMSASPTLTGTVNVDALTASGTITGSVTGNVTGNASTATTLQTARNINGVSFNGTADITVTAAAGTLSGTTLASGVTASSLTSVGTLTSLTVSGDLTVDTSTLKVDSANNRVGIGTASPGTALDVSGAISLQGTTLPAAGVARITSRTSDSSLYIQPATGGSITFLDGSQNTMASFGPTTLTFNTSNTLKMTLDASGNLGLGVTPSAWVDSRAFQIANTSASPIIGGVYALENNGQGLVSNAYYDGTNWKYIYGSSFEAARYELNSGQHRWFYAAAGTSPNTASFTQAMTLDASGKLLVGYTSSVGNAALQVNGNSVGSTDYTAFFVNSSTSTSAYNLVTWSQGASGSATGYVGTGGSATGNTTFRNTFVVGTQSNHPLVFNTNDTERARITSGGAFEITGTLTTTGNIGVPNTVQIGLNGLNSGTRIFAFGGSGQAMQFDAASTACLYLGASTSGSVQLPSIGTTASAANAFIDSGTSNLVLRSTSSIRYKKDVETLEPQYADGVLALRPVWYRSLAEHDNKLWGWYGLIAEEVAEIDPRIVHWGYADEDYEDVCVAEAVENEDGTTTPARTERRVKADATLKPDGVQYERLSVLLLDVVKRQQARLEALEARLEALEA